MSMTGMLDSSGLVFGESFEPEDFLYLYFDDREEASDLRRSEDIDNLETEGILKCLMFMDVGEGVGKGMWLVFLSLGLAPQIPLQ